MSSRGTGLAGSFHRFGQRSTMHGLSHIYQSSDVCRRAFWMVLTVVATCACFTHIHKIISNYLDTPVTSILIDNSAMAEFPDVTVCNLKPASESLTIHYKDIVFHHLERRWGFFDYWMSEDRKRRPGESRISYNRRLRSLFVKYMEIFWVSDDTRDLGMMDRIMLLHCSFNGVACNHKNFTLIQNYRYWNCYDFVPEQEHRFVRSGSRDEMGLNLIVYTDSNFDQSVYDYDAVYSRRKNRTMEETQPSSLREFFRDHSINQILSAGRYENEGILVILHQDKSHPTMSPIHFKVPNGMLATIYVDQTRFSTLSRPGGRSCSPGPQEEVEFVTSFGSNSQGIRRRRFAKTDVEFVLEAKQDLIRSHCGCYSHRYPFTVNTSSLCYFVPNNSSVHPPRSVIDRIRCHDDWVSVAELNTYQLIQESLVAKPCQYTKFYANSDTALWPRVEDLVEFTNEYVVPKFFNGSEFLSSDDDHYHHIFDFVGNKDLIHLVKGGRIQSREQLVLSSLLHQNCRNFSKKRSFLDFWCQKKELLINNVLRVQVKPISPAATTYKEKFSYEWAEALSEIGGVFGLWVGMSLLTFFEFFELLFLIVTCRDRRSAARNPQAADALAEQPLARAEEGDAGARLPLRDAPQRRE